jgi:hypothetical protein
MEKSKSVSVIMSGYPPFDIAQINGELHKERNNDDGSKSIFVNVPKSELSKSPKSDIEFNRYKQDCRKKALEISKELLLSEIVEWERLRQETFQAKKQFTELKPTITSVADKYYNWLISIPNE